MKFIKTAVAITVLFASVAQAQTKNWTAPDFGKEADPALKALAQDPKFMEGLKKLTDGFAAERKTRDAAEQAQYGGLDVQACRDRQVMFDLDKTYKFGGMTNVRSVIGVCDVAKTQITMFCLYTTPRSLKVVKVGEYLTCSKMSEKPADKGYTAYVGGGWHPSDMTDAEYEAYSRPQREVPVLVSIDPASKTFVTSLGNAAPRDQSAIGKRSSK